MAPSRHFATVTMRAPFANSPMTHVEPRQFLGLTSAKRHLPSVLYDKTYERTESEFHISRGRRPSRLSVGVGTRGRTWMSCSPQTIGDCQTENLDLSLTALTRVLASWLRKMFEHAPLRDTELGVRCPGGCLRRTEARDVPRVLDQQSSIGWIGWNARRGHHEGGRAPR